VMPRWDERAFLACVVTRAVRHTHLVPTMMVRLLRLPEAERAAFNPESLSLVMHGAAPITPETKHAMLAWWGPVLVEYWGATEGGVYTLTDSAAWLARPGTVGIATAAFQIYALDDAGVRLPPGEEGTLVCRHARLAEPFVYHGDPAKTEASYRGAHVFTVGDLGWVDAEGYVFLGERRSNLILSGGVNIYPAEIERVLAQHPAIADVAVFGIPDAEWGECVHAAVELAEGFSASPELVAEILAAAREKLGGYKVPRAIDFHPRLPRTEAGKMRVRDLREPFWARVREAPKA
jgi:long-chain acyl-CoA synthetase